MFRFFIPQENVFNNTAEITEREDLHHGKNVLRLKLGEKLELISPNKEYLAEITDINNESIKANILEEFDLDGKKSHIKLYQGMAKGDKFEFIIQKAVELGVDEIIPFESERTIVKYKEKSYSKKQERYEKIIKAAAMQSKRDSIPQLKLPINIKDIKMDDKELGLLAYEESKYPLRQLLENIDEYPTISIIIGAEGGFSEPEVSMLIEKGYNSISLGKRILRTETASLNLLSILGYELER